MKGIGKTVFSGTLIEDFDVEVIDVIKETDDSFPYILVKLTGGRIENNGGISAGMSGSPVYFDGKLAGAISHAWEMSEHNLCLITPIDNMLTLFNYAEKDNYNTKANTSSELNSIDVQFDEKMIKRIFAKEPSLENIKYSSGNDEKALITFNYIQSPLFMNGFNKRAKDYLKEFFKKKGLNIIQNITSVNGTSKNELSVNSNNKTILPGSAIGIQLSTGDINIMGIGTATYIKDNLLLALGHPFLHQGFVSYLLSSVYIYHSFPSMVMPFKIGSPYRLLGEVVQDRNVGILAKLNKYPRIISCKINVRDLDRNVNISAGAKVVPQRELVQSVAPAFLIQSIDNAIDRIGQGTGNVVFKFRNYDNKKIMEYKNMYFDENDIAIKTGEYLEDLLTLLYYNFYQNIDLDEIVMDVEITKDNNRAIIKEVKLDYKDFHPGEIVNIHVIISPFRRPVEEKIIQIKLPNNITAGKAILIVKGGLSKENINDQPDIQDDELFQLEGWTEIEKYLIEQGKYNQITAEITVFDEHEIFSEINENEIEKNTRIKIIEETDFVIEGYKEIYLNITNSEIKEME